MRLRSHQQRLQDLVEQIRNNLPASILAWVVPGGGKSRLPGILAKAFPDYNIAWFVPRLSLQVQAEKAMHDDFGITLRSPDGNETNPARGTRGFVQTHQALWLNPELYVHELRRKQYILVIDELHHAKMFRDGSMNDLAAALDRLEAPIRLNMTGTLQTNDSSMIYGMQYDEVGSKLQVNEKGSADVYIRYNRRQALDEGALVPIEFQHHDGPVEWADKDGKQQTKLSEASREEESAAILTALQTDIANQLFDRGFKHWQTHGQKLIVVTDSQQNAKKYTERLRAMSIPTSQAISDNPTSHAEIKKFREGQNRALVTCQMAYEGLDVPAATHLICLTHIRSTPWIEQMLGRIWRKAPHKTACWAFVPSDPRMNRVIADIKMEEPQSFFNLSKSEGPDGPPALPADAIVPLGSSLANVWWQALDGSIITDATHAEILQALHSFFEARGGSQKYQADLDAFVAAIKAKEEQRDEVFVSHRDREYDIRCSIKKTCSRADREKGLADGTHQKLLIRHTGKSTTEMNLQELEHASQIAARICS